MDCILRETHIKGVSTRGLRRRGNALVSTTYESMVVVASYNTKKASKNARLVEL